MTDSRDQPELETLDYKTPKPLKRGFLGLNARVIKPETRVNSSKVVGQHPEQPNQNLMIIEEIEGLLSQVNDKLKKLDYRSVTSKMSLKRDKTRSQALEEIDLFQKTTLFDLRRAFE